MAEACKGTLSGLRLHPHPPSRMCYLFCRCTRSISLVPAAQYAHLAAFRGRVLCRGGGCPPASRTA